MMICYLFNENFLPEKIASPSIMAFKQRTTWELEDFLNANIFSHNTLKSKIFLDQLIFNLCKLDTSFGLSVDTYHKCYWVSVQV